MRHPVADEEDLEAADEEGIEASSELDLLRQEVDNMKAALTVREIGGGARPAAPCFCIKFNAVLGELAPLSAL